ncbi:MAG: aminoacetone oxidase family FAD-binding enzyme [Bacteroidales bacterium]|nr:aminoacetone oxidase family FAD-binding enzyme [Bacteroidales bacterium]
MKDIISSDIVIIGAGAAGMMAAVGASKRASETLHAVNKNRVTILEKMPRPGRKIMITGKGRCNFTNVKPWSEFSAHIYPKPNFLKPSFFGLTPEAIIGMMEKYGMKSIVERGDRAFPESHEASEVVDTLSAAVRKSGAALLCNKEVCTVSTDEDHGFTVKCADGDIFTCKKLIICTGGLSYPGTGSTGDGYAWAKETGHAIRQTFPSLTALVPKGYKTGNEKGHICRSTPLSETGKLLCGIQLKNVGIALTIDGNAVQNEFGDLDFTDGGIEGPIGFKISRKCVKALTNGARAGISIDTKPAVSPDALHARIISLWEEISKDRRSSGKQYRDRFRILVGKLLPQQLVAGFLRCNPNTDHKTLAKALKNWKFDIDGFVGYERCVITAGGVSLEDVTAKTLESKVVPGLYFAGEVLDLDADTGGYNLHTAFATGYLAGESAAKAL